MKVRITNYLFYSRFLTGVMICLVAVLFLACSRINLNPGDAVAAKWTDGKWYIAKINKCTRSACVAEFHDGSTRELGADSLKKIPGGVSFAVGTKVWALWPTDNAFYDGVIKKIEGDNAVVAWDQGGTPSTVPLNRMFKK